MLELFLKAVASPSGIAIDTNNAEATRTRLFTFKRENPLPDFEQLVIRLDPMKMDTGVWIVKEKK